jgi:hypothetical protein
LEESSDFFVAEASAPSVEARRHRVFC